jgi:hypothetical protein
LISFKTKTISSITSDNCNIGSKFFYYFNGQTKKWEQYKFNGLVGGRGYWVYSDTDSPCSVSFSGIGNVGTADLPPLKAGYNQVGTKSNAPYTFSSTVGSCNNYVSIGPLFWDNRPASQGGQVWVVINPTDNFEINKGYWVYVTSDCSFV